MGEAEPSITSHPIDAARWRALWQLLRWHGPMLLALLLVAAITQSSIVMALAVLFMASVVSRTGLWWSIATETAADASHSIYVWTYGVGAVVFALAAGAAVAIAALDDALPAEDLALPLDILLPAAWCGLEIVRLKLRGWDTTAIPAGLAALAPASQGFQPVHVTLGAQSLALIFASGAAALAAGLSHALDGGVAEAGGALVVALVALTLAVQFGLDIRRLIAGVPVAEATQRALIDCIGRAAIQSGAIRQVAHVEAIHTGPGTILVIVQLDFKDGVAAQHMAPVLAKLRAAAMSEVPAVTDVLLAPPPAQPDESST